MKVLKISLFSSIFLIFVSTLLAQQFPEIDWQPPVNVSQTPGRSSYWSRIASIGNVVHITWWDNNNDSRPGSAYYKRSTDNGTTWQDAIVFSNRSDNFTNIVASENVVIATWLEKETDYGTLRFVVSYDEGLTWTTAADLSPKVNRRIQFATALKGNFAACVWLEKTGGTTSSLKARLSMNAAVNWSDVKIINDNIPTTQSIGFIDVTISDQTITINYCQNTPWELLTITSTDFGETWSTPITLYTVNNPNWVIFPKISSSGSTIVSTWWRHGGISGVYDDDQIAAVKYQNGSWSVPDTLSTTGTGSNAYGDICVWGDRVFAAWRWIEGPGAKMKLLCRRSYDGGTTWGNIEQIVNIPYRFDVLSVANSANDIYITGYNDIDREIHLIRGTFPNSPPIANAGTDQTLECISCCSNNVLLDGSKSYDPDNHSLTYLWKGPFSEGGGVVSGVQPTIMLPLGIHDIELTVDDGNGGTDTDTVLVHVQDTTPPEITAWFEPLDVDDDGGKFRIHIEAVDVCNPDPTVTAVIQLPELTNPDIKFIQNKRKKIKIDLEENEVNVRGPDPQDFWTEVINDGGISVSDGQKLNIELDDEEEAVYLFNKSGDLKKVQSEEVTMMCIATDVSGNSDTVFVSPVFHDEDDDGGGLDKSIGSAESKNSFPIEYRLFQNYPNPFNPETKIQYALPNQDHVRLDIYNVYGEKIITLVNGTISAGNHSIVWNGKEQSGALVASGLYICKFQAGDHQKTIRMLLMK